MTEPSEDDWICTQCYKISDPEEIRYGNWLIFLPIATGIILLILIPSILWLIFLMIIFIGGSLMGASTIASKGIEAMNPFPLAQYIPEAPHTIKLCKFCGSVGKLAQIKERDGQDALYWRKKWYVEDNYLPTNPPPTISQPRRGRN